MAPSEGSGPPIKRTRLSGEDTEDTITVQPRTSEQDAAFSNLVKWANTNAPQVSKDWSPPCIVIFYPSRSLLMRDCGLLFFM